MVLDQSCDARQEAGGDVGTKCELSSEWIR